MKLDKFTKLLTNGESHWESYDVETLSGRKIVVNLNPSYICDVEEIWYNKYTLTWKFPFIKRERRIAVRFVQCEGAQDWHDMSITYTINCSLKAFLEMFGMEATWTEKMMKADIKYGKHN